MTAIELVDSFQNFSGSVKFVNIQKLDIT
jgi:hypothetical protein